MSRRTRDHPREYGENVKFTRFRANSSGPSPRIRGKCEQQSAYRHPHGTIPANTGKIWSPCRLVGVMEDHPREYGENLSRGFYRGSGLGPSPRIRGKYRGWWLRRAGRGTIPANTGKIWLSRRRRSPSWDHPREYGENAAMSWIANPTSGDHPREYGENEQPIDAKTQAMGPSPRIRGEYETGCGG